MNNGVYKGILKRGRKKAPITLIEVVSLYRHMMQPPLKASCKIVADQLTSMGYLSKNGGPVDRHQVFRAMSNSSEGSELLFETLGRIGR